MDNMIELEKMLKEHLEKMSRVHWTLRTEYEQDTKDMTDMIKLIEQIEREREKQEEIELARMFSY